MIEAGPWDQHAITVSAGASTYPSGEAARAQDSFGETARRPLTLPRMADLALYQAKSLGKNQVVCYEPGLDAVLLSG